MDRVPLGARSTLGQHFESLKQELLRGLEPEFAVYVEGRLADPSYRFQRDQSDDDEKRGSKRQRPERSAPKGPPVPKAHDDAMEVDDDAPSIANHAVDESSDDDDSDYRTGLEWKEVGQLASKYTGLAGAHKGHVMGLELGGPDLPGNIVPQWGNWQANGEWRKVEKEIVRRAKEAKKAGGVLHFEAQVIYKQYLRPDLATERGLGVPVGFRVLVREQFRGVPIAPGRRSSTANSTRTRPTSTSGGDSWTRPTPSTRATSRP